MRVIAGKFRSRLLAAVPGEQTRPTYDRLRETFFNVLQSSLPVRGIAMLDLYAGSGAIGIEALSRGAHSLYFVEKERRAAGVLRHNLELLGLKDGAECEITVCESSVSAALRSLENNGLSFDLIFLDPPYAQQKEYTQTLEAIATGKLLSPQGLAVAEHERFYDPGAEFETLHRFRLLTQGNSCLSFYRFSQENAHSKAAEEALARS